MKGIKQLLLVLAVVALVGCESTPTKKNIAGIYLVGKGEELRFFANGMSYDGSSWVQWQLKGREIHVDQSNFRVIFKINENNSFTWIFNKKFC